MDIEEDALYRRLLVGESDASQSDSAAHLPMLSVTPTPAYCLKTKSEGGEKVFINICTSNQLPSPRDISRDELAEIVCSEDATRFRVPLSIGPPHAEMDKSQKGCTVYDIVINPSFLAKTESDPVFLQFFLRVVFDGLEQKYAVTLDRSCTRLKRKKAIGQPVEQIVRTSKKPVIMEMESEEKPNDNNTLIQEVPNEEQQNRAPPPEYLIYREPATGKPEFMVLEVKLPGVRSSKHMTLDVGEDRIVLETTGRATFYLDIDLAYYVSNSDVGAQFNRKTKVLTVTLPVQKT